ncbi:MAG TPA: CBS domain-containing protein [Candidatus Polarisedimenticolia bacterium]|nr:CBS domain-containing protein [Candidatus Polarisedimenticolia bacterium]
MKKCPDIMTKDPVSCAPGDTTDRAALLMKTKEIGPVPVVENRRLVGIVTDRDLAIRVVAVGRDPKKTRVEEVMTRDVVTCRSQEDLEKALEAMTSNQLRRIPVVDEHDQIVGMIAQADVATSLNEPERVAEVVKEISRPGRSETVSQRGRD